MFALRTLFFAEMLLGLCDPVIVRELFVAEMSGLLICFASVTKTHVLPFWVILPRPTDVAHFWANWPQNVSALIEKGFASTCLEGEFTLSCGHFCSEVDMFMGTELDLLFKIQCMLLEKKETIRPGGWELG